MYICYRKAHLQITCRWATAIPSLHREGKLQGSLAWTQQLPWPHVGPLFPGRWLLQVGLVGLTVSHLLADAHLVE